LLRQFPPPYTLASLQHTLQSMGLRVSLKKASLHKLPDAALPCLAVLTAGEGGESGLALILKSDGERLLVLEPGQQAPQSIALAEFSRRFEGHILFAKKQAEEVADPDEAPKQFGFRWFIPELLKYRKIWSEILLASFAIQLVGSTSLPWPKASCCPSRISRSCSRPKPASCAKSW
jgi:subfamily B ATP-binding cassette protein HlyB/CyaB